MKKSVQPIRRLQGSWPRIPMFLLTFICSVLVYGQDTTPPVFVSCPATVADLTATGTNCSVATPNYAASLNATDNVSTGAGIVFSQTPAPGTLLSPGVEAIVVVATDEAGNSANCAFTVTVQSAIQSLACISFVNVTLDADCGGQIVPSMVLTGGGSCLSSTDFTILVEDNNQSNGAEIDGCGQFRYVISEVTVPGGPNIPGFTNCWGYVNAEDKTAPVLVALPTAPTPLFCDDLDVIRVSNLPASVSRCYTVDGQSGLPTANNFVNTALGMKLVAGGGLPVFYDGCSDLEVCVNDLVPNTGDCQDKVITRTFTVRDGDCISASGYQNPPLVVSYPIVIGRPAIPQVLAAVSTVDYDCTEFSIADPNPLPRPQDFPFVPGANGSVFLNNNFCNIGATYVDGPRITTCANTYKFVRTYTVVDWCTPTSIRTFTQLVKVGDFTDPVLTRPTQDLDFNGQPDLGPLFFTTNASGCNSYFVIPAPGVTDDCDPNVTISSVIFRNGDTLSPPIGPFPVGGIAGPIPAGNHVFRYVATDDCGNSSRIFVPFTVGDRTAPVAICEDGLNISLGSNGNAILTAAAINRASSDDCGVVTLAIAKLNAAGQVVGSYAPSLSLNCTDLGNLDVSLRVTDGSGNVNFCWLTVLIEDKTAPICIAPTPRTLTCADLSGDFPEDLNVAFAADLAGTIALLNAQFGAATAIDNCGPTTITQNVVDNRNSCGVGFIQRSFSVRDGQNLTSPPNCVQLINVIGEHDYSIVFPADVENSNCVEPDYVGVDFVTTGCDLITISTHVDTFLATASECYKLRLTYEVLNWCEYGTLAAPYDIPRDADNDGLLNEITVVHVLPNNRTTLNDDVAQLDRDLIRTNFNAIGNLDTGNGGIRPGADPAGYGQDRSRGAFRYQQFIKVYDNTAPVIVTATSSVTFPDNDGNCVADATLTFSVSDECTTTANSVTYALDAFIDPGTDGIYSLADFVADGGQVAGVLTNVGNGNFSLLLRDLPFGEHAVRIRASDGCGNTRLALIVFEVFDNKAPAPICINGLTVTLMPDGQGGGMAAIWASDYIASPSTDCSGPVKYAIYLDGEQPLQPSPNDTGLVLDCSNLGAQAVRIYAIDANGLADYCLTSLIVQAFQPNVCSGPGGDGSLAGVINTAAGLGLGGVEVQLAGISGDGSNQNDLVVTNGVGAYLFTELTPGDDYTILPQHNPAINLSRVTTGDIILISRHILGLAYFVSPYQNLAGDVNNDNNINIVDIIAIRRVILGLSVDYPASDSWRFFAGNGSEQVINVNNLSGNLGGMNFMAVEMGNVSDAGNPNGQEFQSGDNNPGRSAANLEAIITTINGRQEIAINTTAELAGVQGTLVLSPAFRIVEVSEELATMANLNLEELNAGLIGFSYDGAAGELFTLVVEAVGTDRKLENALSLNDRLVYTEGFKTSGEVSTLGLVISAASSLGVAVDATADRFRLDQNSPNPVTEFTTINFMATINGPATLEIRTVDGRIAVVRQLDAVSGMNTVRLERHELPAGLLTYTLSVGKDRASMKMLVF